MIVKKIKCVHCGQTLECKEAVCISKCSCGKVAMNGGVITEGVQGSDWIDVSPKLLNE